MQLKLHIGIEQTFSLSSIDEQMLAIGWKIHLLNLFDPNELKTSSSTTEKMMFSPWGKTHFCGLQSCLLIIICTAINPPFLDKDRPQRVSYTQSRVCNPKLPLFLSPLFMTFPISCVLTHSALPLLGSFGSRNFTWTCLCVCLQCLPGWSTLSGVKQNRHFIFF